jgi:hypothetical protein
LAEGIEEILEADGRDLQEATEVLQGVGGKPVSATIKPLEERHDSISGLGHWEPGT